MGETSDGHHNIQSTIIPTPAAAVSRNQPTQPREKLLASSIEEYLNQAPIIQMGDENMEGSNINEPVFLKYLPRPEWFKQPLIIMRQYLLENVEHNYNFDVAYATAMCVDDYDTHLQLCVTNRLVDIEFWYDHSRYDYEVIDFTYQKYVRECLESGNDDEISKYDDDDDICHTRETNSNESDALIQEKFDFVKKQLTSSIIYFDIDNYVWDTQPTGNADTMRLLPDPKRMGSITYEELVKRYHDMKQMDMDKNTLLHRAIEKNATEVVLDIIRIEVNTYADCAHRDDYISHDRRTATSLATPNKLGVTPLILAAQQGNLTVAQRLLHYGVPLHYASRKQYTGSALFQAAHYGHTKVIECMIDHFHKLTYSEVKFIHFIDFRNKNETTPLMRAAQQGHLSTVKLLLKHGANPDCQNMIGMTPLMFAAQRAHIEICRLLIKHGAQLNIKTNQKSTALLLACKRGHLAIVKELVGAGCALHLLDKQELSTRQVIQRRIQRRRSPPNELFLDPARPRNRLDSYTQRLEQEELYSDDSDGGIDDMDHDIHVVSHATDVKIFLMLLPQSQMELMQLSVRAQRNFEILRIYSLLQSNRVNIKSNRGSEYDVTTIVERLTTTKTCTSDPEFSPCGQAHSPQREPESPALPLEFTHNSMQALLRTMLLPAPLVKTIGLYLPLPCLWDERLIRLCECEDPTEAIILAFDFIDETIEEGGFLSACDAAHIPAPIPHQTWCDWKRIAKPNALWSILEFDDDRWNLPNDNLLAPQRISITTSLPPSPHDVDNPTICELRRLVGYTSLLCQYQSQTDIVTILLDEPYNMPQILIDKLIRISDIASSCRRCCIKSQLSLTMNSDFNNAFTFNRTSVSDIIVLVAELLNWFNTQMLVK